MRIKLLSSIYPINVFDAPHIPAMGTRMTNHFVATATSKPGLVGITLISGFALGISTVWAVDRYSSEKKDFQNRWKYLIGAGITTLTIAGTTLVSLASKINALTAILFAALSLGVILGIRIQEYYNKHSDQKINEFIQGYRPPFRGDISLSLSGCRGCLNYFSLTKLGQKIHEKFNANTELQLLDLTDTDLTDDNLREMAQTGLFDNVRRLVLSCNPRLTGKGIAWIAEKGFAALRELDLTGNEQVIKISLNDWIEKNGFQKLTSLILADTGITENELQHMIEKAEWFRKLKGLNLDGNSELRKFPSNILKLTDLDDHGVSDDVLLSNGPIYFRGAGLFCRGCKNLACTKELLKLANEGKVFGQANNLALNVKNIFKHVDLKRIYKHFNMPFEEERLETVL